MQLTNWADKFPCLILLKCSMACLVWTQWSAEASASEDGPLTRNKDRHAFEINILFRINQFGQNYFILTGFNIEVCPIHLFSTTKTTTAAIAVWRIASDVCVTEKQKNRENNNSVAEHFIIKGGGGGEVSRLLYTSCALVVRWSSWRDLGGTAKISNLTSLHEEKII